MATSPRGQKTLKRVLDAYLDRQRVYSKGKSIKGAACSSRKILEHFGHCSIYDLGPQDLDAFILYRRENGVVDKTINGDLIILRAALNHAVSTGLIKELPFKVKLLKVARRRLNRILTRDEIKKLLECATGRIHGILLVAAHTGFRTDEILHLQWRDVGWDDCSLRITTKDGIWSSKNHQERTVFVSPELMAYLKDHRDQAKFSDAGDWVFSTRNQTPMSVFNVCRAVKAVFQKAGLYEKGTPTIHLIRHTVACTLLGNGTDLETVRDWLGHADISTTSIYLHTTDERKKRASQSLNFV